MNVEWISPDWLERVAGSLLHFVWQGALIAFVTAVSLRLLARRSAASRYTVSVAALGLMVAAPALTFIFYNETGGAALAVLRFLGRSAVEAGNAASAQDIATWTEAIVLAWLVGVTISGGRLIAASILSFRLVRNAQVAIPPEVERLAERVRATLLGTRRVQLRIGANVDTPAVFGWLRPVVLLPITATTGLTEAQLVAVLAHELAHVRRHDFFVNALQRGVEAVLFYHPAVWWLSSRIRAEREHCCDDLAVEACGDRLLYAEALIELERTRAAMPALAVPATGGRLRARVSRVLGIQSVNRDWQPAAAALLLVAVCVLAGNWQTESIAAPALVIAPLSPPVVELLPPIAAPAGATSVETAVGALTAIVTAQAGQTPAPAERWVTTWADRLYSIGNPNEGPNDQTLRMFIRVTVGGTRVRVRLSNTGGDVPLFLGEVHVALHDRGSEIIPGTDRRLTFGGKTSIEIPVGETTLSDPVSLGVPAQAELAVSVYSPNESGQVTGGQGTGYVVSGNHTGAAGFTGAKLTQALSWVSGIDVAGAPDDAAAAVVLLRNQGWLNEFKGRLNGAPSTRNVALLNLTGGSVTTLFSPSYQLEFERLVGNQSAVRWLILCPDFGILYEIILDRTRERGMPGLVPEQGIDALKRLTDLAHARGIRTIGCTLGPEARGPAAGQDAARGAINEWIRSSGAFDFVADFDAVLRDPAQPSRLKEEFSDRGYPSVSNLENSLDRANIDRRNKAMAGAMDLKFFAR